MSATDVDADKDTDAAAAAVAGAPTIALAWGALIHGIVGDLDAAPLMGSPSDAIRQCFAQSPYLKRQ
jgi:hypothetical protein